MALDRWRLWVVRVFLIIFTLYGFKSEQVGGDRDKAAFSNHQCIVVTQYDLSLTVKIKSESTLACFMKPW